MNKHSRTESRKGKSKFKIFGIIMLLTLIAITSITIVSSAQTKKPDKLETLEEKTETKEIKKEDVAIYNNLKSNELVSDKKDIIQKKQTEVTKTKEAKAKKVADKKKTKELTAKKAKASKSAKSTASITFVEGDEPVKKSKPAPKKKTPVTTQSKSGDFMSKVQLNVRSSYSLDASTVTSLEPYTKIKVTEQAHSNDITWYKATVNGKTGWLSSNYLVKYEKSAKPAPKKQTKSSNSSDNKSNPATKTNSTGKSYAPNHIYFAGKAVPYKNTGTSGTSNGNGQSGSAQNVIDTTNNAATFGGAATFSGTDGQNTHFIGHNPGQFSGMHTSSTFIVTDGSGNAYQYDRSNNYVVNEYGVTPNGANKMDRIMGSGGGERITLQSTKTHPSKWIVEASFTKKIN